MAKKQKLQDFVELENGSKLYLLPIFQSNIQQIFTNLKNDFKERGLPIDAPTYTTEADEIFEWDAESVEKDGNNEDKEAWKEHQDAVQAFNSEAEQGVMYYILTESPYKLETKRGNVLDLVIDEIEPEFNPPQAWLDKQKRLSGKISNDPYDLKYQYLSQLIRSVEKQREITSHALALSLKGAISDEGVLKYEAIFRGEMEKAGKEAEQKLDNIPVQVSGMAK